MGIDVRKILGEAFREDLTVTEMMELLAKDTTMIEATELQKANAKADKFAKEAGDYRKQLNANKTAEELAQQQREEERERLLAENERLKKDNQIAQNEKKFISLGYDEKLANITAKALVEGDMETFFKNQQTFVDTQAKKLTEANVKNMKVPSGGGTGDGAITREKLRNMSLSEAQKFANEHPQEYKAIYNQ